MATKLDRFPKKCFNAEGLKASGPVVLEIEEERLEDIIDPKTGRAVEKSVIAFIDTEQKLVLNATNWDLIVDITGSSDSHDWPGHKIELYADRTRMAGKLVDCVRVRRPSGSPPALAAVSSSSPPSSPSSSSKFGSDLDDTIPF
jgi:hypothetical protein